MRPVRSRLTEGIALRQWSKWVTSVCSDCADASWKGKNRDYCLCQKYFWRGCRNQKVLMCQSLESDKGEKEKLRVLARWPSGEQERASEQDGNNGSHGGSVWVSALSQGRPSLLLSFYDVLPTDLITFPWHSSKTNRCLRGCVILMVSLTLSEPRCLLLENVSNHAYLPG